MPFFPTLRPRTTDNGWSPSSQVGHGAETLFLLLLKADSHLACRSPAMPCRWGFRICLSHLIYTVRPCLIHTCHIMLRPCRSSQGHSTGVSRRTCCAVALRRTAWSEDGMASVNQTRKHCVNQMGKTHSKPLMARHGRGTA
jgi:hypothetical protein